MSIIEIQDQIVEEFSLLPDWFAKYEYLIRLGKLHPVMDSVLKTDDTRLQGCLSQVWLSAKMIDELLFFDADSDSVIIRGIIALLVRVMNNQSPNVIKEADLYFLRDTGLQSTLSPSRANGVLSIVGQMKHYGALYSR